MSRDYFLRYSMDHQPTIFYILENESLGTWWVGKMTITLDEYGMCPYRSISQGELNEKLMNKHTLLNPYLTLVTLNKRYNTCYGVERWLSKLEYKINKEPECYKELKKLLMAGWDDNDFTETSTLSVLHVLEENQPIDEIFKKLVTSREGLTRCLNDTKYMTYEEKKKDPTFMYKRSRKEVLRQMEKTKQLPKQSTLDKYQIKEDEIKECMGPTGIIYKIHCEVSGKSYIGKTIQPLKTRIQQHRDSKSYCRILSEAIQEHGWDNFKVSTIWEGNATTLGEMERKLISEHGTMEPGGYNLREGGGRSERVSDTSRKLMIEKQREISKRRDGLLGNVVNNGINKDGTVTSWSINVARDGTSHRVGPFKTKEEVIEVQKKFTEDPDGFEIPPPKRVGNGMADGIYYRKDCNKWQVLPPYTEGKTVSIGTFKTEEEAKEALERYRKDPENFVKPCDNRDDKGVTFKKNENIWHAAFYDGKKNKFLGRYPTKQEAINARNKYLEDPENFVRPNQKKSGNIRPKGNGWQLIYRSKYIGSYKTEEEAIEVLERYKKEILQSG